MLGTTATGSLIRLRAHPLHQTGFVERANAHQHAAYRAIATDPIAPTLSQCAVNDGPVDWIQNNDRIVFHAQCGGCIDPVPGPARGAQLGKDFGGVVAPLGADDDVAALECVNIERVLQHRFVFCQ
ncbi:hypothetical protein GALL_533890 [mine drainage metagenome]|uniref:Uncharacterized protein n=1 Tax=mine drainage metagenome TaxID=410659 RepID=A0A1J5P323_9ZZZZ